MRTYPMQICMLRYDLTTSDDSEDTAEYDHRDKERMVAITLEQRLWVHHADGASFCHIRGALRAKGSLFG